VANAPQASAATPPSSTACTNANSVWGPSIPEPDHAKKPS
jgi:hypothetical protein